jgi:c-di-GMP-binding flagellar brake protein YcgR
MQERRKHPRYSVALPVRVSYLEPGDKPHRQAFRAITENISEGGLAFDSPRRFPLGAVVTCIVRLAPPKGSGRVSFRCTVVRIERSQKVQHVKIAVAAHGHRFLKKQGE